MSDAQTTDQAAVDELAALEREADAALASAPADELEPGGSPPASSSVDELPLSDCIAAMLSISFNHLIAPRAGDHWALNDGESKALGEAYGAVLDKYFPDLTLGVEVTAILVTATVFGPRIAMQAQYTPKETRTDDDDQENPHAQPAASTEGKGFSTATG